MRRAACSAYEAVPTARFLAGARACLHPRSGVFPLGNAPDLKLKAIDMGRTHLDLAIYAAEASPADQRHLRASYHREGACKRNT